MQRFPQGAQGISAFPRRSNSSSLVFSPHPQALAGLLRLQRRQISFGLEVPNRPGTGVLSSLRNIKATHVMLRPLLGWPSPQMGLTPGSHPATMLRVTVGAGGENVDQDKATYSTTQAAQS